eukprot:s1325_g8.t2
MLEPQALAALKAPRPKRGHRSEMSCENREPTRVGLKGHSQGPGEPAVMSLPKETKDDQIGQGYVNVEEDMRSYIERHHREILQRLNFQDEVTVSHDRQEGVEIAMVIQAPKLHSKLSLIFEGNRFPEPVHYRNVDCMGIPSLLSPQECKKIIDFAESSMSFRDHYRSRVVDMSYVDFIDPCFANAFWSAGLGWLLRTMKLEGDLVPCGINEVIRIQKFVQGGYVSLHSDRPINLSDGRVSKYSLRIFLNSGSNSDVSDSTDFEGGVSIFHVPFKEPVIFTACTGMALFYPQGELCTPQEESEVTFGTKYVLRADVLSLLLCSKPPEREATSTSVCFQEQVQPEEIHGEVDQLAAQTSQDFEEVSRSRKLSVYGEVPLPPALDTVAQVFQSELDRVGESEPQIFRTITMQDDQKRKRASLVEESPSRTLDLEEQSQGLRSPESPGTGSASLRLRTKSQKSHGPPGWRGTLRSLVMSVPFEAFFAVCIISNAVFLGVEVEYYVQHPGPSPIWGEVIGQVYNFLFLVELILRLVGLGPTLFFKGESWAWNCMDLLIVGSAIFETLVQITMTLIYAGAPPSTGVESLSNLRVIRIVRITRLVRLTRVARITRFIKALRTLVSSIVFTLKSLIWATVLLCLIIYGFGIVFTQAAVMFVASSTESPPMETLDGIYLYWADLPTSMLTLFMSITGGLSWEAALRPMSKVSPFCVFLLLFYISFSYFAVLNVVTGVFCQSAIESAQSDHDMIMQNIIANKEAHIRKVKSLFTNLDADDSGYISLKELEENIDKKSVTTYFEALELDVHDAWTFFKLLDTDGGSAIEIEEFLLGCLRLRGPARALDLAKMQHEMNWMSQQLGQFMGHVEVNLKKLETGIVKLCEVQMELSTIGSKGKECPKFLSELLYRCPTCYLLRCIQSQRNRRCQRFKSNIHKKCRNLQR